MKKIPEQLDQQEKPETPDEFSTRIDELLDQLFLKDVEKIINRNKQAIKTPDGEWIH